MKLNPKQIVLNMAKQQTNPMINNLISMAEKNDTKGLENFARNLCKEQGRDFDKEMTNFASMLGINKS